MVLALAPLTDYSCKAVLVLVMIDLVSRDRHFAALFAHDWFMSTTLAVLRDIANVRLLPTFIWASCVSLNTVLLDMWLELIQWDVNFRAAVRASECRVL